jgi:hypothetical protein
MEEGFVLYSSHIATDGFIYLSGIPSTQLERYRHTRLAQFIAVGSVL